MKTLSGGQLELQTLPAALINEGQVFLAKGDVWGSSSRYLVQSSKNGLRWHRHQNGVPAKYHEGLMADVSGPFMIDPFKGRGMDGVIRI